VTSPRPRAGDGAPTRTAATARTAAETRTAPAADPPKPPALTLNKIIAAAGAAATSAVVGSLFGAAGTVLGAALGSVVSTLAATIYQHSLDRTRDVVRARIRLPGERARTVDVATIRVPAPRTAPDDGVGRAHVSGRPDVAHRPRPPSAAPARPRRRWFALTAITVGVFLVGLLGVTGVELLKGSTLTRGETGTSVGRVVDPPPAARRTTEPTGTRPTPTETTEPSDTTATPTPEPTSEATDPTTDDESSDTGGGAGPTGEPRQDRPGYDGPDLDAPPQVSPTPTRSRDGD
jgi:hypothetical protein